MKKFYRTISMALLLSILTSFCFGTFSAHAVDTKTSNDSTFFGIQQESKEGVYAFDLGDGFSWSYDTNTKTLTISGKGVFPVSVYDASFRNAQETLFGWIPYFNSIVIEDGITQVEFEGDSALRKTSETLVIGKDCKSFSMPPTKEYRVDSQNPYYSSYDGVLYTKGYKELIACPKDKTSITFPVGVESIEWGAFSPTSIELLILPWGLQKIGSPLFDTRTGVVTVVIPDTVLPDQSDGGTYITYIYSTKNKGTFSGVETYCDDKKTYDYYGVKPNSLHTFENGKTYFFGPNYEYAKGWKQASGNWYYFNDYGAAVVKIWLKSGNKWYFMQADGTMATNKWIQWYNKWYYVGSDGAMYANRWIKSSGKWYYLGSDGTMYTNRYTPDGCWVNGSGVWVK